MAYFLYGNSHKPKQRKNVLILGKKDPSKYIFIPECGYAVFGTVNYATHAYCWFTDWVSADHAYYADLHYNSSIQRTVIGIYQEYLTRWAGLPIRPIRMKTP